MTYPEGLDIARGRTQGVRALHYFGRNTAIGATFTPVTRSGIYRTPQVSGATALRIKAGGNVNDTANGSGARAVTLTGLDATGEIISETIATNGASASAPTVQTFLRLLDATVSASGAYATQAAASHVGSITIEAAAGGLDWANIFDGLFPRGTSEIGAYTVPRGRNAYIRSLRLSCSVDRRVNIALFKRIGVLETAAPYSSMIVVAEFPEVNNTLAIEYDPPLAFPPLTDFIFMASVTTATADVTVSFDVVECTP